MKNQGRDTPRLNTSCRYVTTQQPRTCPMKRTLMITIMNLWTKLPFNLFYPYNNLNIINGVDVMIAICCKSVSKYMYADELNLVCKIL